MFPADDVLIAAVVLMVCANLYYGARIACDRIAMQWGLDGKPTWHAPKRLYLWGSLVFVALVRFVIWLFATYDPQHVHGVNAGIVAFAVIEAAVHVFILKMAVRAN